jgi:general secretion pathway protein F
VPIFEYKGLSAKGKPVAGVKDTDSPRTLKSDLRKEGIYLTQYVERTRAGAKKEVRKGEGLRATGSREVEFRRLFQRIKLMEVAEMTRQLAVLLRAGIPIVDALTAIIAQVETPKLKEIMTGVRQAVNEGSSLGNALSEHPKVFSDLYVNMVHAGESSGTLDLVFERLADFTESQVKLKTKVTGAMVYPIIMVIVSFLIISLLMIFVIPKMTAIFDEMGMDLPLLTRMLKGTSEIFVDFWYLMFGAIFLGVWGFRRWKRSEKGRARWDLMKLRMPIFGKLFRMISIARFSRTLGTLLNSGVPLLNAMTIVRSVVDNAVMEGVVDRAREAIREGESIAGPLERSKQFPPMVTHMIAIGEKTGELEQMLDNVSNSYELQVDSKVSTLTTVLEPLMIVVMGVVVALIVFAILTPMLKMNEAFQGR